MDARQALDQTIETYNLKAVDLARTAGLGANELSRYRRGHSELIANRAFAIVRALPPYAQTYFLYLLSQESQEPQDCLTTTVA